MKKVVIYRDHCTDGFGAAFAVWLTYLGDQDIIFCPMSYGEEISSGLLAEIEGSLLYILDFSFPKEVMEELIRISSSFVWLDHHKTAFEMWCGKYERGINHYEGHTGLNPVVIALDDNKSGAMLAWEYLVGGIVPKIIKHIDDRDRWQFKIPLSKEFHAALQARKPWNFHMWQELMKQVENWDDSVSPHFIYKEGEAILRAQDAAVKSMSKKAVECAIVVPNDNCDCYRGFAVNANIYQSELGHDVATQYGTYALIWYVNEELKVNCSLRSNGDYDVSAIARQFGGGGHKNAAGFQTDINTLMEWLK